MMVDASLNQRMAARLAKAVAFALVAIVGFERQTEESLRLHGLPKDAPAILCGCPSLRARTRTPALETSRDLPNLAAGAMANVDVTVPSVGRAS